MSIKSAIAHKNNSLLYIIISLMTGKFRPTQIWSCPIFRAKFILRSLISPIVTLKYFYQLSKLSDLYQLLSLQGLLLMKPYRPYLYVNLSVNRRAKAIIDHYNIIEQLNNTLRYILRSPGTNLLASFKGRNNESFIINCCASRFDREGELMLALSYESILIASLSFSFILEDQQKTLLIGGLQGPCKNISKKIIRDATKTVYGLFPKRILMEVIFILASACKMQKISAVSNATHVLYSTRYRQRKGKKIFANYNEFWLSIDGKIRKDLLFILPMYIERKHIEDVPSKKRAEYRRRYDLLDNLREQIIQVITD